jgi:hypothetical protein
MTVTGIRPTESRRSQVPRRRRAGAYVDGANALQIGYGETDLAPHRRPDRAPAHEPEAPAERESARRTPQVAGPMSASLPQAPPLPVALPRASSLLLLVGLVAAGVIGVLVINTKINENAFRIDDLRAHQAALNLEEQQLSQQLTELESPGNLVVAAKKLGLVPAGTPAFIDLPDGRVIGVPQPATGDGTSSATADDPGR